MKINLVIEHDFAAAPEAASFLEAIAAAVAKVQRAAKFADGYHATNPLIKAAPTPDGGHVGYVTDGATTGEPEPAEAPETAEAKEKRKRRTKAEMEAARAAEAAAAGNAAPSAPAPSTPAAQAPAPAPSSPAPGASPSDVPTVDQVREAVQRVLSAKGQPVAAACLAPHKKMSEVPPNERAAVIAKCKAALAG